MLEDMLDTNNCDARPVELDQTKIELALNGDRNFSISCELGVRYPTLKAMINRADLHHRISDIFYEYYIYIPEILSCILLTYTMDFALRIVWRQFPPFQTTAASVVLIMTSLFPYLTQPVCG